MQATSIRLTFSFVLGVGVLLMGCATAPKERAWAALSFPPPPAKARVQYLGALSSPSDLPNQRSTFADFILGPEQVVNILAKPNNAVMSGSRLLIGDTVMNTVYVYDLETGASRRIRGDRGNGKIRQPNGLAVDADGRLYVADKLRKAVLIYGPDEEFIDAWGSPGELEPVAVAIGEGVLYVCDIGEHEIEIWSLEDGSFLDKFGGFGMDTGQFAMPTFLAIDPDGNLLVTDTGHCRVQKFSPAGEFLSTFGKLGVRLGDFAWPKGIAVDGNGRIYVADTRFANVQIFNDQGQLLLFFGGPGYDLGNLDLPSGVSSHPWPSLPWLDERVEGDFDPEYLVIVVNQQGPAFVNFFAVARDGALADEVANEPSSEFDLTVPESPEPSEDAVE